MSAAAPAPSLNRNPTKGYAEIPNSLIENQAILTRAELSLALIVLRRAGPDGAAPISDANWQNWTGLSARNKEYAAAGLREKGLVIEGRGDAARYSWRRSTWDSYVRQFGKQLEKPRTLGRVKGVSPKPGAKVHPDCAEKGCAMMCDPAKLCTTENGLTLVPAIKLAQPVAQTASETGLQVGLGDIVSGLTPAKSTKLAQPVAQTEKQTANAWPVSLAAIRNVFPFVGVPFLGRLVGTVRRDFPRVTDPQLAAAIAAAWQEKRHVQKTEGLFLKTVPDVLAQFQHKPAPAPAPDTGAALRAQMHAAAAQLRRLGGAEFTLLADRLDETARNSLAGDFEAVELWLQDIEAGIIQAAGDYLEPHSRASIAAAVEKGVFDHGAKMSRLQAEKLGDTIRARETLAALGVPRLGLFYA